MKRMLSVLLLSMLLGISLVSAQAEMAQEARRVMEAWSREAGGELEAAVAVFSSACGLVETTENAADCLNRWRQQEGIQK